MLRKKKRCGWYYLTIIAILFSLPTNLSSQTICEVEPILLDSTGSAISCNIFQGKTMLVYNSPPQCHDCEESIYNFLAQLNVSKSQLHIVFGPYGNAFVRQQLRSSAHRILNGEFIALYYSGNANTEIRGITPIIYLISNGKIIEKFTTRQIFSDDMSANTIHKAVQKKIRRFLNSPTSETLIK